MNRRQFLLNSFKWGGAVACAALGFSIREIAWASHVQKAKKKASGSSCNTTVSACTGSPLGTHGIAVFATQIYVGTPVTGDGSAVCGVDAELYKVGTPNYTLRAVFYTDSSGPNVQHGLVSSDVEATTITPTDAAGATSNPTRFTFTTPTTLSDTVKYYFVIFSPDGDQSNDHYVAWNRGVCSEGGTYIDNDGTGTWSTGHASQGAYHTVKKE